LPYLIGTHDAKLVILSMVVASLAAYIALALAGRVTAHIGILGKLWLMGGAFSMGIGIWSMHFIGMLAFVLPIPVNYDISLTLLSLLIAMAISGFALFTVSRPEVGLKQFIAGGAILGSGICVMHFTGMFAMRMHPAITYDPVLLTLAVLIAFVASFAALWLAFKLRTDDFQKYRSRNILGALIMGLAITAVHYTAMAAANFDGNSICLAQGGVNRKWLAITVSLAAFSILSVTLLLSIIDSLLASQYARLVRALQEANEKLNHTVLHDNLTKLPNRLLLEERANQTLVSAQRAGKCFAMMFIDLDYFKVINDTLGHHCGDQILQETAQRVSEMLRAEDIIARVGGDEFVVLLKEVGNPKIASHVAEKILHVLSQVFHIDGKELNISPSIGISLYPNDGLDIHTLMVNADKAMYRAKDQGRSQYQFFNPERNTVSGEESLRPFSDVKSSSQYPA
jgi:diguanylate cyclase